MWQTRWEGAWGRMDIYVCVAESLCCIPETITALFDNCYTPIKNKKFEKKKKGVVTKKMAERELPLLWGVSLA